jgi:hypothetical protein
MNWRDELGLEELKRERPPRGAIVIVAIGLVACVVAVLATTDKGSGGFAYLEWVQKTKLPDSKAVAVPGGTEKMQLVDGFIRSTGTNVSGYNAFQVATELRIGAEAPIADSHIICTIHGGPGAEIGRSQGGLRTLYPRSSDGIYTQPGPETVVLDFSSHGTEFAALDVSDLPQKWTTERGIKLDWPEYEPGTEHLNYFNAGGKPKQELVLPFDAIWRSTKPPAASVACTVKTSAGKATVETAGELKKLPPPIDEEAEEEERERREEEDTAAEEETDEAGGEGE